MAAQTIKMHWVTTDKETNMGYMREYVLPTGETVSFNEETNLIDLLPLKKYIGTEVDYFLDNEYQWTRKIVAVDRNEEGVMGVEFPTAEALAQ